jgi:hypothetical protein
MRSSVAPELLVSLLARSRFDSLCPTMHRRASPEPLTAAEASGFDLTLIEASLRCTYDERAIQHQQALEFATLLEKTGQTLRDPAEPPAPTSARR